MGKPILSMVLFIAVTIILTACTSLQTSGGHKKLYENEYADKINVYLKGFDQRFFVQVRSVMNGQDDLKNNKEFASYLMKSAEEISKLNPPDKFVEDNQKIIKMFRTYYKSIQDEVDGKSKENLSLQKESAEYFKDTMRIRDTLQYFGLDDQYRVKTTMLTARKSSQETSGGHKKLTEEEYVDKINVYLNGFDLRLAVKVKFETSIGEDLKSNKEFASYLMKSAEEVSELNPPDKFVEDNQKIIKMFRTYYKSIQVDVDGVLKESANYFIDSMRIRDTLQYFGLDGQYRVYF